MKKDPRFIVLLNYVLMCGQAYWRLARAESDEIARGICRAECLRVQTPAEFQVERITLEPFAAIPRHAHPDVDSYELPLSGSGEMFIEHHRFKLTGYDWKPLFIGRGKWHGGHALQHGGMFLSVQHWHIPITGSLTTNWDE